MADTYNILDNVVDIFPSSNAQGSGKVTSELNLKAIITRLNIQNYVINDPGLSLSSGTLTIPSGYAVNVDGFKIEFSTTTTISGVPSDCSIYVELRINSLDHLLVGNEGTSYTHGALITFNTPAQGVPYLLIGEVAGGILNTDNANRFPISSDSISNGDTNKSLTEYINSGAKDEFLSRITDDTKKGNVTFAATGSTKDLLIDNTKIQLLDNSIETLKISGDTISNTIGNIVFDKTNNELSVDSSTKVVIKKGTTKLTVEDNQVTIGNTTFIIDGNNIKIKPMSGKVIIDSDLDVTGNINATGTIDGAKVFHAVYN